MNQSKRNLFNNWKKRNITVVVPHETLLENFSEFCRKWLFFGFSFVCWLLLFFLTSTTRSWPKGFHIGTSKQKNKTVEGGSGCVGHWYWICIRSGRRKNHENRQVVGGKQWHTRCAASAGFKGVGTMARAQGNAIREGLTRIHGRLSGWQIGDGVQCRLCLRCWFLNSVWRWRRISMSRPALAGNLNNCDMCTVGNSLDDGMRCRKRLELFVSSPSYAYHSTWHGWCCSDIWWHYGVLSVVPLTWWCYPWTVGEQRQIMNMENPPTWTNVLDWLFECC